MAAFDSIMLCGFGGPTPGCCGRRAQCDQSCAGFEAECFVAKICGDDPAQAARIAEVTEHYRHFGGYSPYNARSEVQRAALEAELERRGHALPVVVGYRNWPPWYADGWRRLVAAGCQRTLLVVLAPHQGKRSWDDYLAEAAAAREGIVDCPEIVGHAEALYQHPGFIDALVQRVFAAMGAVEADALLLTAHAIPQPAERGAYRPQVETTARLVAEAVGLPAWRLGFQSAPDDSPIPWSQPTMEACLAELAAAGARRVVALPIGFLVDHMEVLYDLDVELQAQADELGVELLRARSVEDHPAFISALAESVLARA
ncbi:MAG: ferrochelatase [Planctomycetota bacterium]|nr:MAG: ferrochelatase [Planctomycetota bacterium]